MVKWNLCFTCTFWREQFTDPSNAIIVNGTHYRIERKRNADTPKACLGHGGQIWHIRKFPTDRNKAVYIRTNNLWCQGKIPDRWYEGDNARFLSEEEFNDKKDR